MALKFNLLICQDFLRNSMIKGLTDRLGRPNYPLGASFILFLHNPEFLCNQTAKEYKTSLTPFLFSGIPRVPVDPLFGWLGFVIVIVVWPSAVIKSSNATRMAGRHGNDLSGQSNPLKQMNT